MFDTKKWLVVSWVVDLFLGGIGATVCALMGVEAYAAPLIPLFIHTCVLAIYAAEYDR
jgi:hypothetical protein